MGEQILRIPLFGPPLNGIYLVLALDISGAEELIQQLTDRCEHTRPLLVAISGVIRRGFSKNFAAGGRPGWAPLAPSTIARKMRQGLPPHNAKGQIPKRFQQAGAWGPDTKLIASGKLRASYVERHAAGSYERIDEEENTVEAGSQAKTDKGKPYAVFLNRGTSRGLPARPQTLGDDDISKIIELIRNHLAGNSPYPD